MASLSVNGQGVFFLRDFSEEDSALAHKTGLTWSRTGKCWYTDSPYAALVFWEYADFEAELELYPLRHEYEASWRLEMDKTFPAPPGLDYFPFQRAGIQYGVDHGHVLIGDQPGLGKTMQAIGIANALKTRRHLVVCPANVRLQWEAKIKEWSVLPIHRRGMIRTMLKGKQGLPDEKHMPAWLIISYDLLRDRALQERIAAYPWDIVVLDEAHYAKTMQASRTRALFGGGDPDHGGFDVGACHKAQKIVALTGTPLPNRPRECYTIARHLCWEAIDGASYDGFTHRYNPSATMPTGARLERTGRLPELHNRLRCNFMVRRMKADVLTQLPDTQYEMTYIEENAGIRNVLRAESALGIDPLDIAQGKLGMDQQGHVATIRREMGEAKVPLVAQHVDGLLDGGLDKVLVFTWHKTVLAELAERLRKYKPLTIEGSTSASAKYDRVEKFISEPKHQVLIGQIQSMGTGTDGIQKAANHAVFAEASWSPGQNEQAVDRLARMGQDNGVIAQFLIVPKSFDERVLGSWISKVHQIDATLDRRNG
jgi:SNF2 family DNA or RNA helicase